MEEKNSELEMASTQECADPNEPKPAAKEESEVEPSTRENKDLQMDNTQEYTDPNEEKPAVKEEADVEPSTRKNEHLEMGSTQEYADPNEEKPAEKEEAEVKLSTCENEDLEMSSTQEIADPNGQIPAAKEETEVESSTHENKNLEIGSTQEIADSNEQKPAAKEETERENKDLKMGSTQEIANPNEENPAAQEEAEVEPPMRENEDVEMGNTQEIANPNEENPAAQEEAKVEPPMRENEDLDISSTQEIADPNEEKTTAKEEVEVEPSARENMELQLDNNHELAGPSVQRPVVDEEAMEKERRRRENEQDRLEFFARQSQAFQRLFTYEKIANYTEYLMYGTPIQIQSEVNIFRGIMNPCMQISVLIIDLLHDIDFIKDWPDPLVTLSITNRCLRRNIFTCVSAAEKEPNTPVLYGDDIYIRVYYSLGQELYLTGNMHRIDNLGKIPICLTDWPDNFTKFQIVDPDPSRRSDLLGTPVKNFKSVCIVQTFSNQLLTADMTGISDLIRDNPIVCDTFDGDVFNITPENYFNFRTQEKYLLESDTDSDEQDNCGYNGCGEPSTP